MNNEEMLHLLKNYLDESLEKFEARLEVKLDAKLDAKIDSLETRLNAKIDSLETRLNAKIDSLETRLDSKINSVFDAVLELSREVKDLNLRFQKWEREIIDLKRRVVQINADAGLALNRTYEIEADIDKIIDKMKTEIQALKQAQ